MAQDPRVTGLRRSERAVWRYLARQADDDGVVPHPISTKRLADRVEYAPDTVRRAAHRLQDLGMLRVTPGQGRTRTLYAVPAVLGAVIAAPEDRGRPRARTDSPRAETAGTPRSTTTPTTSARSADAPSTQATIPGIPRQSGPNDAMPEESPSVAGPLQENGAAPEVPRALWCDAARARGAVHPNSRCCHTTKRETAAREAAEAKERARLAREAEMQAWREDEARRRAENIPKIKDGAAAARRALAENKARHNPHHRAQAG